MLHFVKLVKPLLLAVHLLGLVLLMKLVLSLKLPLRLWIFVTHGSRGYWLPPWRTGWRRRPVPAGKSLGFLGRIAPFSLSAIGKWSHQARSSRSSYGSQSRDTESTETLALVGFTVSVSSTRAEGS